MIDAAKKERMDKSAEYFWNKIRPILEPRLKAVIYPLELLQRNALIDAFDQVGIDAFTVNRGGYLQGLASRMQYTNNAAERANFSFRYALANKREKEKWDYNREYQRKLHAIGHTDKAILYPYYHVESCIIGDVIHWSYITKTADIIQYISKYIGDESRVKIYEPKSGEKRLVVCAYIKEFKEENKNVERIA